MIKTIDYRLPNRNETINVCKTFENLQKRILIFICFWKFLEVTISNFPNFQDNYQGKMHDLGFTFLFNTCKQMQIPQMMDGVIMIKTINLELAIT